MKDEICHVELNQKRGAEIRGAIGPIYLSPLSPESIECLIEDQAFSPSCSPSPFLVGKLDRRHARRLRKRDNLLTGEGVRSQIIRRGVSLVLYKSFNIHSHHPPNPLPPSQQQTVICLPPLPPRQPLRSCSRTCQKYEDAWRRRMQTGAATQR
jgi:hypothetical protein